jgi:hypothetical protein
MMGCEIEHLICCTGKSRKGSGWDNDHPTYVELVFFKAGKRGKGLRERFMFSLWVDGKGVLNVCKGPLYVSS